jgi:acyl transferase domain-containing protein
VVVLKPLSQALADEDPIYAVIRASVVNQDGSKSSLPAPNGAAQERAMRMAYEQAGIAPHHIQYVETQGTGTPVGDPTEAKAIGAVIGANRQPGNDCLIGSVKTNIGHLEGAAGIASLIKTVLALKHGQISANLHFQTPNPKIPFEQL